MPGLYETLRDRIRAEAPVALATVIEGPHVGAKLLVTPDEEPLGTLGDPELDRIVARDTRAEGSSCERQRPTCAAVRAAMTKAAGISPSIWRQQHVHARGHRHGN